MIKELVENYVKACNELKQATGVYAWPLDLQCSVQNLVEFAAQYEAEIKVSSRGKEQYPWNLEVNVEGYKFYAIATDEELETYMKGRVA